MTTASRPRSAQLFDRAQQLMPGGVNSPVRAFRNVGGNPLFFERAEGPYMWDVDGNRYIDYVGAWGPAILGHADPDVIAAIQEQASKGLGFGAPTDLENQLAALVIEAVPSIERLRFVNSGTEALISAIRLARAATHRPKLIKFAGCYHGHGDAFLVKAGSGATTLGVPDSAGVPETTALQTLTAHYNDLDSVVTLFEANPDSVAAVVVEPVTGNMGCIPPEAGFLEGLRQLCDAHGALLIFDEVMTGFRVAYGGAQTLYGVMPDITCLGKIVGGGMPAAAYGGRDELMRHIAPEGPMYQAGTLSGHPLAMVAGLITLQKLKQPGVYQQLEAQSQQLATGLRSQFKQHGIVGQIHQVGGMLGMFLTETPVRDYDSALTTDKALFTRLFWGLIARGVYLAPSPYEAGFISLAHTPEIIDTTLEAFDVTWASILPVRA